MTIFRVKLKGADLINSLLSIAMIVKNEQAMLSHTLPHLVDLGIPIWVGDTGSTDGTISYLAGMGVNVFRIENWGRNFSVARNAVLDKISSQWVLFLDADEYIAADSIRQIMTMIQSTDKSYFYLPIYQNDLLEKSTDQPQNSRIKLFRTDRGYHYIRPVNEDLDIPTATDSDLFLEMPIFHWGNSVLTDPDRYQKKIENYIDIFNQTLSDPQYAKDDMLHFQLARHLLSLNRQDEAYQHCLKAIIYAGKTVHRITKFMYYYELIKILKDRSKSERAIRLLLAMEKRYELLNKALFFELGSFFFRKEQWKNAEAYFMKSLMFKNPYEDQYATYPIETKGFHQLLYLGITEEMLENYKQAYLCFQEAQKLNNNNFIEEALERLEKFL